MEDADVNLFSPTDMMGQNVRMMEVSRAENLANVPSTPAISCSIVSGAFDKLGESVKKRVATSSVGFGGSASEVDS
ncbi:MAG: hypothetical protein LR015_02285 [Verrucomicrobia bacterium]|nr:hypothetical protein [Verrucomicrobiota bacterium]